MTKKIFLWFFAIVLLGGILLWWYWPKIETSYYDSVLSAKIVVLPHSEWALQGMDYDGEYREMDTIMELEEYGRVPGTVYAFEPKPVTFTFVSPYYDTIDTTIILIGDSTLSFYGHGRNYYVYRDGEFISKTAGDNIKEPHMAMCYNEYGSVSWAESIFEGTHYVTVYKTYTPHGDSLLERKVTIEGYPPVLKAEETRVIASAYLDTLTEFAFQCMALANLANREVPKNLIEFDSNGVDINRITFHEYSFPPFYYFKCGKTIYEIK
jgi:hypothetical protein